jgi:hypothetical protein
MVEGILISPQFPPFVSPVSPRGRLPSISPADMERAIVEPFPTYWKQAINKTKGLPTDSRFPARIANFANFANSEGVVDFREPVNRSSLLSFLPLVDVFVNIITGFDPRPTTKSAYAGSSTVDRPDAVEAIPLADGLSLQFCEGKRPC